MKWEWLEAGQAGVVAVSTAIGAALKGLYDWSRAKKDDDREIREIWRLEGANLRERLEREERRTEQLREENATLRIQMAALQGTIEAEAQRKKILEEELQDLAELVESLKTRIRTLEARHTCPVLPPVITEEDLPPPESTNPDA